MSFFKTLLLSSSSRFDDYLGIPPPTLKMDGEIVSWRKYIAEKYSSSFVNQEDVTRYFHYENKNTSLTFIVAVTGERTLWGNDIRDKVHHVPKELDKILLIEIPDDDILWCEPIDYSVDETMLLIDSSCFSRGFLQHPGLMYITLHGEYGMLSEFSSEKDLRDKIEFSAQEMNLLDNVIKGIPVQRVTDDPKLKVETSKPEKK